MKKSLPKKGSKLRKREKVERDKPLIIGFSDSKVQAKRLAKHLGMQYMHLEEKKFTDSETYIRFPKKIKGRKIIFYADLSNPDTKFIPLLFALHTSKDLGAKENILVAPYLPYMRQDKRFHEGECVSNKIIASLLNPVVDRMYTYHPHLHRVKNLNQIFKFKCRNLSLLEEVGSYIENKLPDSVIIGPDIESSQWVDLLAKKIGAEDMVMLKKRISAEKVIIRIDKKKLDRLPRSQKLVIFDDIISSGATMIDLINILRKEGFNNINVICIHGIFAENAYYKMKQSGAKTIISSNTIHHFSNRIDIIQSLSKEIKNDM